MRGLLSAALILLSFGHSQSGRADTTVDFLNYGYSVKDGKIVGRGMLETVVPRFDEIQQNQNRFQTYPQFLDYLFERAPSLKKHFILIHHSQSQQISSIEFPRVIMFDGGVAYSVSEHPANRELRVEMLEMDKQTYAFSTHEIRFTKEGVKFEAQPSSCAACHGISPKPLWAPYDFWPNAFGSSVGMIGVKQEGLAYSAVLNQREKSEILRRLDLSPQIGIGQEENTAFTQFIYNLSAMRWMKKNIPSDFPKGFAYPLISQLTGCSSDFSDSPEIQTEKWVSLFQTDEQKLVRDRLNLIQAETTAAKKHFDLYQDQIFAQIFPNPDVLFKIDHDRLALDQLANAKFRTALDLAGIDAADLSSNHTGNDFDLSTPSSFSIDLGTVLFDTHPELFSDLPVESMKLGGVDRENWIKVDCDILKQKSLSAQRDLSLPSRFQGYQKVQTARPVISRCAKCHSEGMSFLAPSIPFDDSLAFANALRDPKAKWRERIEAAVDSGKMPPEAPLTLEEKKALKAFLQVMQ